VGCFYWSNIILKKQKTYAQAQKSKWASFRLGGYIFVSVAYAPQSPCLAVSMKCKNEEKTMKIFEEFVLCTHQNGVLKCIHIFLFGGTGCTLCILHEMREG